MHPACRQHADRPAARSPYHARCAALALPRVLPEDGHSRRQIRSRERGVRASA
jgi:hypothetical protein